MNQGHKDNTGKGRSEEEPSDELAFHSNPQFGHLECK